MSETSNFGFGGNPDIEAALSEAQERTELSPDLKQDPKAIGWLVEELAGIYERQLEAEDATIAGEEHEASSPLTESEQADIRTRLVRELAQLSQGAPVDGMLFADVFNAVNLASLLNEYYAKRSDEGLNA